MTDKERLVELLDGYYSEENTDVASQFMEGDSANVVTYFTEEDCEKIADYLLENGVITLPCKVGDTVYMAVGKWNTITGYEEDKCDGFFINRDGVLQIKVTARVGNHATYGILGRTAFLSREEAELAIKNGEECGENGIST